MSQIEIERALRAAFALDPAASPGPGFEARMVRAARARGRRMRAAPALLAAAVAGAAVATLAIGRGRDQPAPPRIAVHPAAAAPPSAGPPSLTEFWELVIRFRHGWSANRELDGDQPPAEESEELVRPPPRHQPRLPAAEPRIDCGDDPLCPLVAPNAARLHVVASPAGRVFIDGQDAGATPLDIEVIPGRHRVGIRADDGGWRNMAVVLRPGERRMLTFELPGAAVRPDRR